MALLLLFVGAFVGLFLGELGGLGEGVAFGFAALGAVVGGALDVRNFRQARRAKREAAQQLGELQERTKRLESDVKSLYDALNRLDVQARTDVTGAEVSEIVETEVPDFTASDEIVTAESEPLEPYTDFSTGEDVISEGPTQTEALNSEETVSSAWEAYEPEPPVDEPPVPSLFERLLGFFTGGNTVARVGIVLLTIGLGFAVQFAAREGWLPVELRLAGAALVGLVLVGLGWRLRHTRNTYALSLQGGGVGVIYLSVFAAMQLYGLIPTTLGFVLLVLVAVAAAVLAVAQDSLPLAVLGSVGGFLAPFFAAGEGGSHVTLFSYYLVLNAGILLVAWRKAWRPLNLVGFVGTFVAGTLWGGLNYRPGLFASTEPFLLTFFAMYLALAVLYALKQPPKLRGLMDASLVFSLPAVAFGLQTALVGRFEFGIALSALGFAAVYLLLALALFKRAPKELGALAEAFTALGIIFTALVLPFAFDATWASAGWALGAAGLVWIGVRQRRLWLRVFGLGWHLLALAALGLLAVVNLFSMDGPNALTLDALASALALLFSAYTLYRARTGVKLWESLLSPVYMGLGLLSWAFAGQLQIGRLAADYNDATFLLFLALTALVCNLLSCRLEWPTLNTPALGLPLIAALFLFDVFDTFFNRFSEALSVSSLAFSAVVWVAVIALCALILRRSDRGKRVLEGLYALTLWVAGAALLIHSFVFEALFTNLRGWSVLMVAVPFTMLIWVLSGREVRMRTWLHPKVDKLLLYGVAPLTSVLWLGSFALNSLPPSGAPPLPYLPLLNPLDLALGFALLTLVRFLLSVRAELELARPLRRSLTWALIALGLFWTSGIITRSVHTWFGVPYRFEALYASNLLQTSLSIFWSLFALVAMLVARRRGSRTPWLVGAGLLGVVVLKLFFVELAGASALARVISFVGVGLLLLLIGYLAPLPPTQKTEEVVA